MEVLQSLVAVCSNLYLLIGISLECNSFSKGKGQTKMPLIAISPLQLATAYIVFAGLMKQRIQSKLEAHGALSDLQNGFRPDCRISDNLFVLLQLIEIAHKKSLYLCFLDIKGAFDIVNREILWQQLYSIPHRVENPVTTNTGKSSMQSLYHFLKNVPVTAHAFCAPALCMFF